MATISSDLRRHLDACADDRHDVIVMAAGSLEALLEAVPGGVDIRHVFKLRKGVAARASAADIEAMAASGAVASIEPDRPVRASKSSRDPGA